VLGTWKLRFAAIVAGAIVIPGLLVGLDGFDMSAIGHLCALILGTLFAVVFTERGRRWLADRRPAIPLPTKVALRKPATVG
jgi:membrane associated rhomboid family serine protease